MPLRSPTAGSLTALYGAMERDGLSASTRRLTHAVLRRALKDAKRWGKIARNPAADVTPPSRPKSGASAWTAYEPRAFLARVQDDRLFAPMETGGDDRNAPWRAAGGLLAGTRPRERPPAGRSAVDPDTRRLHVRATEVQAL